MCAGFGFAGKSTYESRAYPFEIFQDLGDSIVIYLAAKIAAGRSGKSQMQE